MKTLLRSMLLVATACLIGCASTDSKITLAPVGPAPNTPTASNSDGALVVYSAFATAPQFDSSYPYHRSHTDYQVFRENGQLLQTVRNDPGGLDNTPARVRLAPGNYRVVARANGHGLVTVPVVIVANQTTAVHLDGEMDSSFLSVTNKVTLPDGQVVGWRAAENSSPR